MVKWYTIDMITLALYSFFFIYLAGVVLFATLIFVSIGHLIHTGTFTLPSFVVTLLCFAFVAIIGWLTWYLLLNTDWQTPITIWNNRWFGTVFTTDQIFSPFK